MRTILRRLLPILILFVLVAGSPYAYRQWKLSRDTSHLRQCRQARDAGKWVELRRLGAEWSARDRLNADAWLFQADACQHLGDFESAATCLASIPEADPKVLPSLVSLSHLQFGSLNRPFDGVRTCERILKLDRRATAAHDQLIEYYALTLQRKKLEHHIRFAIESSREPPKAYVYLFLIDTMRVSMGVETNTRWMTHYPDLELFAVARVLQMPEPDGGVSSDDKYSLADALFRKFPDNLELLAYHVDLSLRRGDVDKVTSLLLNLPAEADDDPRFWRAKGWLHLNREELQKATEALQQAIDLFPMDWSARNWLADVLRRESRMTEAERLNETVQSARSLRTRITSTDLGRDVPADILKELAEFARRCGDLQVADALNRRLE